MGTTHNKEILQVITPLTMNGTEQSLALTGANYIDLVIKASGADITLRTTATSGAAFVIADGETLVINGSLISAGQTLYFTGDAPGVLYVLARVGQYI